MQKRFDFWRYLPYIVVVICFLVLLLVFRMEDISMQTILEFTPENPIRAAVVMLLLYAAKGATVFFPLTILQMTVGHLFPAWTALAINCAGLLIVLTVPYWTGRLVGMDATQRLIRKYPRLEKLIELQQGNSVFLCFFLRMISCLPGDVVTMYLGATRTPFLRNLFAGALGAFLGMVLTTLIGKSIQDFGSPMFWLFILLKMTLSMLSILLYHLCAAGTSSCLWPDRRQRRLSLAACAS